MTNSIWLKALDIAFIFLLAIIANRDARTRTVSNFFFIVLFSLAIIRMFGISSALPLLGLFPALLTALFFYHDGESIGGADIKCMASIGVYLGLLPALRSYLIAFVLAIILSVVKKLFRQNKEEVGIPLCVYLAIGVTMTILSKHIVGDYTLNI